MAQIETEINIAAPPSTVWKILTDFEAYPQWNSFIKSISGTIAEGQTLTVIIKPPGSKVMTFKPVVLRCDAPTEFRWKGKTLYKGILDGEHYFILRATAEGHTRLVHGEVFTGLFAGLISGLLDATTSGFEAMNQGLKERCERQA